MVVYLKRRRYLTRGGGIDGLQKVEAEIDVFHVLSRDPLLECHSILHGQNDLLLCQVL